VKLAILAFTISGQVTEPRRWRGRGPTGSLAPAGAAVGADSWKSDPVTSRNPVIVHRVVRRVLSSPIPPEIVSHLGEGLVAVVGEPHAEQSQPERQAGDELIPEEDRVLLTRGQKTKHGLVEVQGKLPTLQTGETVEELQVRKGLQKAATVIVLRVISAVAGSDSGLHWRPGNKIGGFQDHKPNASRRSVLSAVMVKTVRQELKPINISPGSWRESGDRLRQIRISV